MRKHYAQHKNEIQFPLIEIDLCKQGFISHRENGSSSSSPKLTELTKYNKIMLYMFKI